MTIETVGGITAEMFKTVLYIAGPPLLAGLIVGLLVGLFQSVTQIQEFTLTFVPKILVVLTCLFLLMPWMSEKLMSYTSNLIQQIPSYVR